MAEPVLDGWLRDFVFDALGDREEVVFDASEHPRAVAAFRRQLDLPVRSQRGGSGHYRVRVAPRNLLISVTLMPQDKVEQVRLRRYG